MGLPEDGAREWVRTQVSTSRNVTPNWFNDWYFGGLHYQIEHHLFPRVPRHNLWRVKQLLMPFCKKHNIEYCSTGPFTAISDVVASLGDVGLQLRLFNERQALAKH